MGKIAIIGGTGSASLKGLEVVERNDVNTPYGAASGSLTHGLLFGKAIIFLPRHGYNHTIPPHKINYCANLWALKEAGVDRIIAIAAVGGIAADFPPGKLAFPDQIIDYTWGRKNTFYDGDSENVVHVDFTHPYDEDLRQQLMNACKQADVDFCKNGVYAATQGPRLETAAEVNRLEQDGCTMIGMTGMPEAVLAKELGLAYAACTISVNWAAGRSEGEITMAKIAEASKTGTEKTGAMLAKFIPVS